MASLLIPEYIPPAERDEEVKIQGQRVKVLNFQRNQGMGVKGLHVDLRWIKNNQPKVEERSVREIML